MDSTLIPTFDNAMGQNYYFKSLKKQQRMTLSRAGNRAPFGFSGWPPAKVPGVLEGVGEADFFPDVDAYETETEFKVELEIPGIPRDSIKIDTTEGTLIISGEKQQDLDLNSSLFVRLGERDFGSFKRSIRMPLSCDASQIKATVEDGLLSITIPKKTSLRRIPIR